MKFADNSNFYCLNLIVKFSAIYLKRFLLCSRCFIIKIRNAIFHGRMKET